jgi:hypothetical protein
MLDRLARCLRNMDQVIVNCPTEMRAAWSQVLKGSGVHGEVTSGLAREIGALGVVHRDNVSTLLISTGPLGIRARAAKRVFDIAVSAGALVLLSPVLLAAGLLIKVGGRRADPVPATPARPGEPLLPDLQAAHDAGRRKRCGRQSLDRPRR